MMIKLKKLNFIGKGTNRACYIHPNDTNKCIKVTISNDYSESNQEIRYYKYLEKRSISFENITKYYGIVKTDLGEGGVFDLVRDVDGNISKTLSYYLQKDELTKEILNPIVLLKELRKYTLAEGIVVKDLNTKNMLYQKREDGAKLILIDGVVNNDFLFYSNYLNYLASKKINKLWDDFESTLSRKYSFNKYFLELLKGLYDG